MVLINDNSSVLAIGDAMPPFSLPACDGTTIDSSQIQTDVTVVIFNCNHCPYAQAYEKRFLDLHQAWQGSSVTMVMINSNDAENYPEDSFDAMKEKHYPFTYCFDESQDVAKSFGALCTPHCFVFDSAKALQYKGQVDDNWKDASAVENPTLQNAVSALVAGETPAVQEAHAIGCSIKWK